ncbi:cytochrome P450 [Paracraurococcus ruber]|uniref:Cytochrome P450 n=1 Tax=Paracraurococcus ruber TaxID=77675 RepID=A0ABS1CU11_9PROT|nr:cytochrome P450 [Paracraurococcus ruber]MBK1657957.1 cytochrome P450 [Paracraurococcus ruber]TDG31641.1 cytochrome P450 [Paracraurococcus ruber]
MAIPDSDIDPFCAEFFEDPHPAQEALREAGPVVRLTRYGILAVARHAEVKSVLDDWQAFTSARGVGIQDFAKEQPARPPSIVLETDPPLHDRTRRVQARVLSPAAIAALREGFTAAAEALADRLLQQREFDAIPALAEAYPLEVFPDAMGMPRENRHHLLPWGNLVFNSFGPKNEYLAAAIDGAKDATPWVFEQSKRENLTATGFGAGIHAAADTGDLTAEETPQVVRSVLTAGVDTTVSGIGAAVYCLARYPAEFARLRADPKLARNAFEEAVRYESPVQTFFRTATREVDLGGATVPEGSKVLMFLGAANRDPRKWDRPDDYDIGRRTVGHVGFGSGIHACVGMALARLEGECVLAALAKRATRIEITGEPRRRYNNTLRGLASLPVRLHAA